jgi:hypothetical protein
MTTKKIKLALETAAAVLYFIAAAHDTHLLQSWAALLNLSAAILAWKD